LRVVDLNMTVDECDSPPFANALPASWRTESAPGRVIALLED
jgi:hypothetical protein